MKKLITVAAASAVALSIAHADDEDILMSSTVAERCEVDVVSSSVNVQFSYDQTLAELEFTCNLNAPVAIKVTSANAQTAGRDSFIANTGAGGSQELDYTIDVLPLAAAETVSIFGFQVFTDNLTNNDNVPIATGGNTFGPFPAGTFLDPITVDLRINIDGVSGDANRLYAGQYTDTVNVSISAN